MLEDVCIVDRIEEDTKNRVNTAAFACWVWMQNPNLLPRVSVFTLFPAGVGQVLETGGMPTPSQEVASAPLGRVRHLLIHLDMVEDWRPLPARSSNSSGSTDSDDPPRRRVHRFDWHLGYEDGVSPRRRASAAASLDGDFTRLATNMGIDLRNGCREVGGMSCPAPS